MNPTSQDNFNFAFGALLGACIGDAAGATLEFLGRTPTQEEVRRAGTGTFAGHRCREGIIRFRSMSLVRSFLRDWNFIGV